MKKFCGHQVTTKEDFKNDKQISWTCSAHLHEDRVFICNYKSYKDSQERQYPCVDVRLMKVTE